MDSDLRDGPNGMEIREHQSSQFQSRMICLWLLMPIGGFLGMALWLWICTLIYPSLSGEIFTNTRYDDIPSYAQATIFGGLLVAGLIGGGSASGIWLTWLRVDKKLDPEVHAHLVNGTFPDSLEGRRVSGSLMAMGVFALAVMSEILRRFDFEYWWIALLSGAGWLIFWMMAPILGALKKISSGSP